MTKANAILTLAESMSSREYLAQQYAIAHNVEGYTDVYTFSDNSQLVLGVSEALAVEGVP